LFNKWVLVKEVAGRQTGKIRIREIFRQKRLTAATVVHKIK